MAAIQQQAVTLTGELSAWRAVNADGWGVGTLDTDLECVDVVGKLVGVRAGSTVQLEGVWADHPKYGRQLKVRRCTAVRPDSTVGVVAWLGSALPDVGVARARALVERFGVGLWDVILWQPDRLTEIDGITPARADAIREAYLDVEADRVHMVALRTWGLTDSQVARCVAAWGSLAGAVERIRANPYDLASHVHGFGFERSDVVALKAGVPHDSPARVQAGVRHLLEEASAAGHMYMSGGALQRMAAELLGVPAGLIPPAIKDLSRGRVVTRRGWRVYLQRLEAAEATCASVLALLIGKDRV